jgi:hypothetical protein
MKKFSCYNFSHLQEALTRQRRTPWQRKLREGWLTSVHALPQWPPVLRHSSLVQNCSKAKVKHAPTLSRLFVSLPYAGPGLMRLAGSTIAQRIDDPRIAYRETGSGHPANETRSYKPPSRRIDTNSVLLFLLLLHPCEGINEAITVASSNRSGAWCLLRHGLSKT